MENGAKENGWGKIRERGKEKKIGRRCEGKR
jgi:hypothetical protein